MNTYKCRLFGNNNLKKVIAFNYKWHLFFSFFLFFICVIFINLEFSTWHIIGLIIGTLLPDIDTNKSTINNILIVTKLLSFIFSHRGFTHSIIGFIIISYVSCLIDICLWLNGISVGIAIGYFCHLITDMSTPMGIQLLWPLPIFIKIPIISHNDFFAKTFWIMLLLFVSFKCSNII